jgi:RNA 3'-terminal phosphate cyclase (ATP)
LTPLHLPDRGEITQRVARAVVAALPGEIAKRELKKIEEMLGWTGEQLQIRQLPAEWGPGNMLTLEIHSEHLTEIFTGFGMKAVSAETVAEQAALKVRRYLAANVPVGEHLADQLLVPMALAGSGSFLTLAPTRHATTNAAVIQQFLPVRIAMENAGDDTCRIAVDR